MGPTNNIGYLLQHLATTLARQSEQVLQEKLGTGFSQFKILMALQWNPHVQQRQIAEALGQTEASISRQIKLMLEKDLLRSQVSPHNRRERITTPTPKGLKLAESVREVLNSYHGPMFEQLSQSQREQLLQTLTIMHEYSCQAGKTAACHRPFTT